MDKKKRQILETAKGLFVGQGFNSTTMQSIADAAGISKGAVYLHFSSKKDIFFEILMACEEEAWDQVQQINSDQSTTAREKLVGIFEMYFEYVQENRLLTELQIHEVGIAMTEQMLAQTLAIRVRWQKLFDDRIATVLGNDYDAWKGDLGFTVVAILEMYHASMVFDGLQIEKQSLIDYLLLLVETLGPALANASKQGTIKPMLKPEYLATREKTLEDLEQKRHNDIQTVLTKMQQTLTKLKSPTSRDQQSIYQDSVRILQQECLSKAPNKAIIQGMLAGIRGVTELSVHRQQLAELMSVRLV